MAEAVIMHQTPPIYHLKSEEPSTTASGKKGAIGYTLTTRRTVCFAGSANDGTRSIVVVRLYGNCSLHLHKNRLCS